MSKLFTYAILYNDLPLLYELIRCMGEICIDLQEINQAIFFFDQMRQLSEMERNYKQKIVSFTELARCGNLLREYQSTITILKKALQYAWYINDDREELAIYSLLSLNSFYSGQVDNSILYHTKYSMNQHEPLNSNYRYTSNNFLNYYFKNLPPQESNIQRQIIIKLFLPLQNFASLENIPPELMAKVQDINYLQFKFMSYANADGKQLIKRLLQEDEFNFQQQTPTNSQNHQLANDAQFGQSRKQIQQNFTKRHINVELAPLRQMMRKKMDKEKMQNTFVEKANRGKDPRVFKLTFEEEIRSRIE